MKPTTLLAAALAFAAALCAPVSGLRAAVSTDVFFTETFDAPADLGSRWSGAPITTETRSPGHALKIHNPSTQSTYLHAVLPPEVKGRRLVVRALLRGEAISAKPAPHNGVKLALLYSLPGGATYHTAQADVAAGTFDWRDACVQAEIPANAVSVWVRVGLEAVSGTAWFDELSVEADPVVREDTFDDAALVSARWSGASYSFTARASGSALAVSNSNASAVATLSSTLPIDALRGRRLLLTGEVKANAVSSKPASHNGIKVMLSYTNSNGVTFWPQAEIPTGTFDWRNVYAVVNLPSDAVSARLVIGLEKVSGTAWFDNLRITINPVLHGDDFDDAGAATRWSPGAGFSLVSRGAGSALQVTNANSTASVLVTKPLSAAALRGRSVFLRGLISATDVSAKPAAHNGIKVMLVCSHAGGGTSHLQIPLGVGTFGWTPFQTLLAIPDDVVSASLTLGLERVSGTVAFDDVTLRLDTGRPYWTNPTPHHKGHALSALRGTMVDTTLDAADVADLDLWNVNLVRWQLGKLAYRDGLLRSDFDSLLAAEAAKLDAVLPALRAAGIAVVLDLHSLSEGLFANATAQRRLIDAWRLLAGRYRTGGTVADGGAVWAYDLANEPNQAQWNENLLDWNELAEQVARAIRETDASKTLIVESVLGEASRFSWLRPIEIDRVVYSFHYYRPWTYTAQGLDFGKPHVPVNYPGTVEGASWDRARIAADLQNVADFQTKHRVSIYVGEFSVLRWAPGGAAYLADCIDVFEEKGWDWSYHAFREWQGWNVEIDAATPRHLSNPSATTTDRLQTLLDAWAANPPFVL